MTGLTDNLDAIAEEVRRTFVRRDKAREKVMPVCREVIRFSSITIRAVHRQEFDEAVKTLGSAHDLLKEAEAAAADWEELRYAGFVRDAQKEYAEASITLALATARPLPGPDDLGVDVVAYVNGMGEAAGELRRYLLDGMRQGNLARGEELLAAMDEIYGVLVTMDFPDGITGGLRRTTDMVRGVLEKTRSDLTLNMGQQVLMKRLDEFAREIGKGKKKD
jgi:translin